MPSRELSNEEIKLLERGLKFTPTPKQNRSELKTDIQEFSRKLRLLEYFNDQQPNGDDKSLVNEHYAELTDLNYDDKIIKKIGKHLKKFDQETTKKEKEYLQNFAWKTSNFY